MQSSKRQKKISHCIYAKYPSVFVCLVLLFLACNSPKSDKRIPVSPDAKAILDKVESLDYKAGDEYRMHFLDSAYQTLKNPTFVDLYEKYNVKGKFYIKNNFNIKQAHVYADSMLYLLKGREKGYPYRYARSVFFKGDVFFAERKYNVAFQHYYNARKFALETLDTCGFFEFTYRLGMVKYQQERYIDAISYLKKAFFESRNCTGIINGDEVTASRQGYLNSIGLCYERIEQLDSAITYFKNSLAFIDQNVQKLSENERLLQASRGVVYGNLGGVYAKCNTFNQAEKYLKLSISINDHPGYEPFDAKTAKLKLAKLYIDNKRFKDAAKLINEVEVATDYSSPGIPARIRIDLYHLKWQYYDKRGNHFLAYQNMQDYHLLKDSVFKVNQSLRRSDIDVAFESSEKEYKIALLSKDRVIKRNYLISFAGLSLLTIIVLFMVWQNRKRLQLVNAKITAQNAAMQMTMKVLEHSMEENTLMMKIVTHDLRNPIAATIHATEMLKVLELSAEHLEILELLDEVCQRSMDMIDSLLNINFNPNELIKEPVEMSKFLTQCVNLLKFKADEKKQILEISTTKVIVDINKEKIWRLFSNLIYNAIKFSPPESKILIGMHMEMDEIVFSFRDFGIGIPIELQDKIFDIFTAAKRSGTFGEHSVGLGLAISKQIVLAHNGSIGFKSQAGKGTTFCVKLPIKQSR